MDAANDDSERIKTCTKCGETKPTGEFNKHAGRKDGLADWCKPCKHACDAEYRRRNPNKNKEDYAKRIAENPNYWAERYAKDPEKERDRVRSWAEQNKDLVRQMRSEWYEANGREYGAKWRAANKDKIRAKNKKSYEKVKDDPIWRVENTLRVGIHRSLGDAKSGRHWEDLVGYTISELTAHLESLFSPGMSWENYGREGWEVDHKIPRSVFNYKTPDDIDFKRCWALENLQPLWASDNRSKSAKLDAPFQPSLAIAA